MTERKGIKAGRVGSARRVKELTEGVNALSCSYGKLNTDHERMKKQLVLLRGRLAEVESAVARVHDVLCDMESGTDPYGRLQQDRVGSSDRNAPQRRKRR